MFDSEEHEKTFHFVAKDEKERTEWVEFIQSCIEQQAAPTAVNNIFEST